MFSYITCVNVEFWLLSPLLFYNKSVCCLNINCLKLRTCFAKIVEWQCIFGLWFSASGLAAETCHHLCIQHQQRWYMGSFYVLKAVLWICKGDICRGLYWKWPMWVFMDSLNIKKQQMNFFKQSIMFASDSFLMWSIVFNALQYMLCGCFELWGVSWINKRSILNEGHDWEYQCHTCIL